MCCICTISPREANEFQVKYCAWSVSVRPSDQMPYFSDTVSLVEVPMLRKVDWYRFADVSNLCYHVMFFGPDGIEN